MLKAPALPMIANKFSKPPKVFYLQHGTVIEHGRSVELSEYLILLRAGLYRHSVFILGAKGVAIILGRKNHIESVIRLPVLILCKNPPFMADSTVSLPIFNGNAEGIYSSQLMALVVLTVRVFRRVSQITKAVSDVPPKRDLLQPSACAEPVPYVFIGPNAAAKVQHSHILIPAE